MDEVSFGGGSSYNLNILLDFAKEKQHLTQIKTFYCYALLIIYNLIFCEKIKVFDKNEELNQMYNNLKETINDRTYIVDKLYYIYEKLYKNLFEEVMTKEDFYTLICIKNQIDILKRIEINDFIVPIEIDMTLEEKENIIVGKIQKKHFQELINIKNSNSYNELLMIIKTSIIQTIQIIQNKISFDELLKMLSNLDSSANKVYNNLDSFEAQQEKERLLNGDMTKEIEIQKQAVEYSNVQNGYEFEEYVANLYKKLGYTIEEVTKKSGDQRCRCNRI